MTTWAIKYTQIPTAYNRPEVALVEAGTADDAVALLKHQLRECYDLSTPGAYVRNYVIGEPREYLAPKVEGRVLALRGGEGV